MRKYLLTFFLMSILCLSACSGGVAQEEYDALLLENETLQSENAELESDNESLRASLGEAADLIEQYSNESREEIMDSSALIFYEAAANIISEDATCVPLNENIVQITVPLNGKSVDDFSEQLETATLSISLSLGEEYSSCIVMFVDDEGRCEAGFSYADQHVTGFLRID